MAKSFLAFAIAALIFAGCASDDDAAPTATEPSASAAPTTAAPTTVAPEAPASTAPTTTTSQSEAQDNLVDIAAGIRHTCALSASGSISCWGENENGQLGNGEFGTNLYSTVPVRVQDITDAVAIGTGWEHTCAVHATGEVSCWGRNDDGQLGNGTDGLENNSNTPVKVLGITDAVSISAGYYSLTCVLHATGEVSCWGSSQRSELGTSGDIGGIYSSVDHSAVPVKIEGITDATAVGAGNNHACVLHETGEVSCWGDNTLGELGTADHIPDDFTGTPLKVVGIEDVQAISAGSFHTCVIRESGEVTCWGWDDQGQLGDGRALDVTNSFTPVRVFGL